MSRRGYVQLVGATLALWVVAACAMSGSPTPRADGPVILISIDTLRADRLPAYGSTVVDTPAIDALVRDAVVFENAFTHAPTTLPSHASVMTGLLPAQHGVRDNIGYSIDESTPTLAELLRAAGYNTGAAVSAYPLRANTGMARGFDFYDDAFQPSDTGGVADVQRDGMETYAAAHDWIAQQEDERFFLFFHIFEPHAPYQAPQALAARYEDPYDAEVARADQIVGRLLTTLRERDLYDDALIVLLSDHGESLGDHGEDDHGIFLYGATTRVPLIVKFPDNVRADTRESGNAQLVDVLPTVLDATAVALPAGARGRALGTEGATDAQRFVYMETFQPRLHFGWSELLSVIDYPLQYIEAPEPELYDLVADPRQRANLIALRPADASRLADELRGLTSPFDAPSPVDPEVRDRLAALGYVSGGTVSAEGATLPDPKTKIHLLRHLKGAAALFFAGNLEDAADEYQAALEESPGMSSAWEFLGRAQMGLGRLEAATESFEMLVALGGATSITHIALANMYLDLGRLDDAAVAANRAVVDSPYAGRLLLARIAMRRQLPDDAEALAIRLTQLSPDDARGFAVWAEALLSSGKRLDEAARHIATAQRLAGGSGQGLGVIAGRIAEARGLDDEALVAYSREIEHNPTNLQAYRLTAVIQLRQRQTQRSVATLSAMMRANPGPRSAAWAVQTLREGGEIALAEQWFQRAVATYPELASNGRS